MLSLTPHPSKFWSDGCGVVCLMVRESGVITYVISRFSLVMRLWQDFRYEDKKRTQEQASCTRWSRTTEGRGLLRLWPQGKLPAPGNLPRAHRVPVPPDEPAPLVAAAGIPLQSDA